MSYLQKIVDGHDLSMEEAEALMGEIFEGATDAQIGALLIALRMKGESVSEIAGLARRMRSSALRIHPRVNGTLVDTCGTGGGRGQHHQREHGSRDSGCLLRGSGGQARKLRRELKMRER